MILIAGSMICSTSSPIPAFLLVAWDRVRGNKGARTAGVDGQTAYYVEAEVGVEVFLDRLRAEIKDRSFRPLPVRERMIPKPGTAKRRRLGISAVRDRVVQASLKLVLEPIFEADFLPCSYGFRPKRRAHDAVAEVRHFTSRSYEWVVEGDIKACFDEISHPALHGPGAGTRRGQTRPGPGEGVPQGRHPRRGSPAAGNRRRNPARFDPLPVAQQRGPVGPGRVHRPGSGRARASRNDRLTRRRHGLPNYRLSGYADDWCLVVSGTKADAEALREEIAGVLSTMGLRLSPEKTLITHIDEGLDFLGWHIQRRRKRGTNRRYVYTYPARKAVKAVTGKVKTRCRQNTNLPLETLLRQLNPVLRGWSAYFRPGVSSIAFGYLRAFTWRQVIRWLRRKHPGNHLEGTPPPLLRSRMVARRR